MDVYNNLILADNTTATASDYSQIIIIIFVIYETINLSHIVIAWEGAQKGQHQKKMKWYYNSFNQDAELNSLLLPKLLHS